MPIGVALGNAKKKKIINLKIINQLQNYHISYFFFFFIGSYLYSYVVNKSYVIMFTINATCIALAIIYSLFNLKVSRSYIIIN